jgi:hypothetical protein
MRSGAEASGWARNSLNGKKPAGAWEASCSEYEKSTSIVCSTVCQQVHSSPFPAGFDQSSAPTSLSRGTTSSKSSANSSGPTDMERRYVHPPSSRAAASAQPEGRLQAPARQPAVAYSGSVWWRFRLRRR